MPVWSSKSEVKEALQAARRNLKQARSTHGKESDEAKAYLKECNDLQAVLDRWDALHS